MWDPTFELTRREWRERIAAGETPDWRGRIPCEEPVVPGDEEEAFDFPSAADAWLRFEDEKVEVFAPSALSELVKEQPTADG
jgi:hypothetical protein